MGIWDAGLLGWTAGWEAADAIFKFGFIGAFRVLGCAGAARVLGCCWVAGCCAAGLYGCMAGWEAADDIVKSVGSFELFRFLGSSEALALTL